MEQAEVRYADARAAVPSSNPYRGNAAVTALSGLAFMAGGSTPGRGPYGPEVAIRNPSGKPICPII